MKVVLLLLTITSTLFGRLNEDIVALEARYGPPTFVWSSPGSAETFALFNFQGRTIWTVLSEGDCAFESINFGPTKVYSNEQATKLGSETGKFIIGLLSSAYDWPEKDAAEVCAKFDVPISHGDMIAKYTLDVTVLRLENTWKSQVIVMTKEMKDEPFRLKISKALAAGLESLEKKERKSKADGF